ncbi:BatD family protein [Sulfurimonas sp.]|nr:BatD family protein [Sulfurimonas sp.]
MNKYFTSLILLLTITMTTHADVRAELDSNSVELGDMVTYSLSVSGENITRPTIQRICDSDVISTASQTSMQVINGAISKSYILSYKFLPQKSCKIDPVEVDINGVKEFSNALDLKVNPVSAAKDKDFILELSSSKKSVYVGEPFEVTLRFKQKQNSQAVDSKFTPPELKGFWVKK